MSVRRALAVFLAWWSVACGGSSAAPAAPAEQPTPPPSAAGAEVTVLEIRPFALTAGDDGVILRLHADGRIEGRNIHSARLTADGHIVSESGAALPFEVNAAGEVRAEGELVARIEGSRMTFAEEGSTTAFEHVPGAVQMIEDGSVMESLTLEGDPPSRTVLFLTVLAMFAGGASGP